METKSKYITGETLFLISYAAMATHVFKQLLVFSAWVLAWGYSYYHPGEELSATVSTLAGWLMGAYTVLTLLQLLAFCYERLGWRE